MGKTSDLIPDKLRSVARQQGRHSTRDPDRDSTGGAILPTHNNNLTDTHDTSNSGGLNEKDGVGYPSISSSASGDGSIAGPCGAPAATSTGNQGGPSQSAHATASPTVKSEATRAGDPSVGTADGAETATAPKPPMTTRMTQGSKRFVIHTKNALCHSWINVLLIFVPIGIAAEAAHMSPTIVFALNAVAIVPLAGLLSHATESVASRLGDTIGALLNVTFGNAVELIIFIIALVKNEIRIVQASLLGSILANLLLILGMAFLLGGLRYREQIYNSTVTQMSACLLSLSVMSLLLPTAFHASFKEEKADAAQTAVLAVSRGTSVILLLVYGLYLLFQLKSHAYMYESTPQEIIEAESHPGVLADMMDSSSSSDSSSVSSSSDSDTSGDSGSVRNAGKRIKRMIKRRRRKSSASIASVSSPSSSLPPVLSSTATTTERQGNSWEHAINSQQSSRRPSVLATPFGADDDNLDADVEAGHNNTTRVRDFGDSNGGDVAKSLERKKPHKKSKKHHKKRRAEEAAALSEKPPVEQIEPVRTNSGPRLGFAEDISTAESQPITDSSTAKRPFNMRGFSRAPAFRPGLTKMLSNNVFATPPPPASSLHVPVPTLRGRPTIRRTSSLPDRLNQQQSLPPAQQQPTTVRSDPLPPFQHQSLVRRVGSEEEGTKDETADGKLVMSRTAAVVMLLLSTALVAVCAEFLVEAIPEMIDESPVSEAFVGLIILPIVGNAAEHVTAVTVAAKNKMDLAIGVAVGSSIQIALFVTPVVVLLGWILNTEMSLYFNLFETISLFATAFVVNFLVLDGRSNYLEGSLLIAAYVIIALGAFYYPGTDEQSVIGGGNA